ncbi:MAG: Fic family protein [Oligoflexia bacterium]|nr:Fic family protein [Oligoflexia bacterium]
MRRSTSIIAIFVIQFLLVIGNFSYASDQEVIGGCKYKAKEFLLRDLFAYIKTENSNENLRPKLLPDKDSQLLNSTNIVQFPLTTFQIIPYKYEKELADFNELPLSQAVALLRNFHNKPVKNGLFGFYVVKKNKDDKETMKVRMIKGINLFSAYKLANESIKKKNAFSEEDIINIRRSAEEIIYKKNNSNKNFKPRIQKFNWIPDKKTILMNSPLNKEVVTRLERLGCVVKSYQQYNEIPPEILKNNPYYFKPQKEMKDLYSISYPDSSVQKKNLANYVVKLNKMLQEKKLPAERIATFAVQELLIMHPFDDGNGRTARILGQVIYEHLTGKSIIFPPEFHKELDYSEDDLVKKITISSK